MRQLIELVIDSSIQNSIGFSPNLRTFTSNDGTVNVQSQPFAVGVKSAADNLPAEIALYGEIGDPWEAADVASVGAFLRSNKGRPVNVRINSGGGLAYEGIAIHNALAAHDGAVTTIIEGIAGSAASVIAVGGHKVQIYENAHFFIHCAAMLAMGRATTFEDGARWLRKVDDAIARTYKAKTNRAIDKILEMMHGAEDGTIFTAKEAVDAKFVDEIVSIKPLKAKAFIEASQAKRLRSQLAVYTGFPPAE